MIILQVLAMHHDVVVNVHKPKSTLQSTVFVVATKNKFTTNPTKQNTQVLTSASGGRINDILLGLVVVVVFVVGVVGVVVDDEEECVGDSTLSIDALNISLLGLALSYIIA
jgi:hypothetical protein